MNENISPQHCHIRIIKIPPKQTLNLKHNHKTSCCKCFSGTKNLKSEIRNNQIPWFPLWPGGTDFIAGMENSFEDSNHFENNGKTTTFLIKPSISRAGFIYMCVHRHRPRVKLCTEFNGMDYGVGGV